MVDFLLVSCASGSDIQLCRGNSQDIAHPNHVVPGKVQQPLIERNELRINEEAANLFRRMRTPDRIVTNIVAEKWWRMRDKKRGIPLRMWQLEQMACDLTWYPDVFSMQLRKRMSYRDNRLCFRT